MPLPHEKLHIAILFGGRSGEHEVSLRSARSVIEAIDRQRFEVCLIGIDLEGHWHIIEEEQFHRLAARPMAVLTGDGIDVTLLPAPDQGRLHTRAGVGVTLPRIDVVFPVLHGTFGEDGTVQGFLDLADVPYVGAGVLGAAIGMDKDVQKRLLQAAGLPIVPFVTATSFQWERQTTETRHRALSLGLPLFVKPANLGSSVGISKVAEAGQLDDAVALALRFDTKIVIERGLDVREIELAVLGNDEVRVSIPGEVCPRDHFYSYEAKYVDEDGAKLLIPAPLNSDQIRAAQALAERVFHCLEGAGLARVDLFLERRTGTLYVNEVNTIPGFTSISMYPKLWEASGIPYPELISRLIELALARHAQRQRLQRTYVSPPPGNSAIARNPSR